MGGDDAALTAVVDRTGIFPDSAAIKMRGDLISDDPERAAAAMTRAAKVIAKGDGALAAGRAEKKRVPGRLDALRPRAVAALVKPVFRSSASHPCF